MDIRTQCVHGRAGAADPTGAVAVPIYQTATFSHPALGKSTGYDYGREQNPTREALEKTIAGLEHGEDALAFSSGMAAITALMELFAPGDAILSSGDLYGGTIRLFDSISRKNGLQIEYADTTNPVDVEARLKPRTRAVFIETPTNPMMLVTDIAAVAAVAHRHGALLIVDNTFLTPYFQTPIPLGADIVVHSGTKYLCGHNDTLAGFLVAASRPLAQKLREIYKTTGACLSPFDSWLLLRGIKTLPVRMEAQQKNAVKVARWMLGQPKIRKVYYIGLPDHPGYEVTRKQTRGFGAMISFEVDRFETALSILNRVKLILFAESLGGVESLITYPATQTHSDVPRQQRESRGINDRLLRLSVGLEAPDDLIADLAQAIS